MISKWIMKCLLLFNKNQGASFICKSHLVETKMDPTPALFNNLGLRRNLVKFLDISAVCSLYFIG